MAYESNFGDRLRADLKKKGIKLKDVIDSKVISKSHLQSVLSNEKDITILKFLTMAHLFGLDYFYIIMGITQEEYIKKQSNNKIREEISEYLVNNHDIPRVVNGYNKLTKKQKELVRNLIDELTLLNDQINDGFLTKGD